jgi:hypothetical protein
MQKVIQCEDPNLADLMCKKGYYTVGVKNFYSKIYALREASKTRQSVKWNFNQEVYASQCDNPRLDIPLTELYKMRAQQLRDSYDYLILAFSGGADSDTILKTFVDADIKLDEVWHDHPATFVDKSGYKLSLSTESWNAISEWSLVVKPELDRLSISNPEIKIHVSDACATPTIEDFEDTERVLTIPVPYSITKRYRYIDSYIKNLPYARVGILFGIDKCIPAMQGTSYGFLFTDAATFMKNSATEYFYWTPDMPQLVVEQAHRIWDYLKINQATAINKLKSHRYSNTMWKYRRYGFDEIAKLVCYPTWDFDKHQVNKYSLLNGEHVAIYNDIFKNELFYQSWVSNFNQALVGLDPTVAFQNKKNADDDIAKFVNFHKLGELTWDI